MLLLIADKLPELVKTQAEAIKNIKIDKVTVWENGGGGKDGKHQLQTLFQDYTNQFLLYRKCLIWQVCNYLII